MMWPGRDEPLYEERILGERVRFVWNQSGAVHTIRAEWVRGENPWEIENVEVSDTTRHLAIEKATAEIRGRIEAAKAVAGGKASAYPLRG